MNERVDLQSILGPHSLPQDSRESDSVVRILRIPDKLQESARNEGRVQSVYGEVIRTEKDGSIRVKTDYGTIVLKERENAERGKSLENGQAVTIKIPPKAVNGQDDQVVLYKNPSSKTDIPVDPRSTSVNVNNVQAKAQSIEEHIRQFSSFPVSQVSDLTKIDLPNLSISKVALTQIEQTVLAALPSLIAFADNVLVSELLAPASAFIPSAQSLSFLPSIDDGALTDKSITSEFQTPKTTLPLSLVAAKLLTTPIESLIAVDKAFFNTEASAPLVSGIQVQGLQNPVFALPELPSERSIFIPSPYEAVHAQAGELKAVLEGFSEDRHYPVLRITAPDAFAGQLLKVEQNIDGLRYNQIFTLQEVAAPSVEVAPSAPVIAGDKTVPIPHNIAAFPALTLPYFTTPGQWESLSALVASLSQANAAQVVVANQGAVIPNAGQPANIPAAALFFLSAVRSGDFSTWLGGKGVEMLKRVGKGELLNRIGTEFSMMSRMHAESAGQEWRTLPLPFAWQDDVHKVIMHYRKDHQRDSDDQSREQGTTRFILNLSLSQIGSVQMDGLYIENGAKREQKRLEIILRTEERFSEPVQAHLRGLYKDALEETEIIGALNFQNGLKYWVEISAGQERDFTAQI